MTPLPVGGGHSLEVAAVIDAYGLGIRGFGFCRCGFRIHRQEAVHPAHPLRGRQTEPLRLPGRMIRCDGYIHHNHKIIRMNS